MTVHSPFFEVITYQKGRVYFGRFYLGKRQDRREGAAFPRGGFLAEKTK